MTDVTAALGSFITRVAVSYTFAMYVEDEISTL